MITSENHDIYRNLALEEWLLESAPSVPVLFFYVNDPCVVIGKNQNPWRECRLSRMEKEGVMLARRISGGGAVYHDSGNLNVSVIVPRTGYDEKNLYNLMIGALAEFDVKASRLGANSLGCDGLKISGHAFCHRRERTLHHATLLVQADLNRLIRYLGPEMAEIKTKAVMSIPAEVGNLTQFSSGVNMAELMGKLTETFCEMYTGNKVAENPVDVMVADEALFPVIERNKSNEWLYEKTPPFKVAVDGRLVEVRKGRIINNKRAQLFSDLIKETGPDPMQIG